MAFEVFEVGLGDFKVSNFTAEVYEKELHVPKTVIRTNQDWGVNVKWETSGEASEHLEGVWSVSIWLEAIGPGDGYVIGDKHVKLTPQKGTVKYNVDIECKAGAVPLPPPASHESQPFMLVTTVTYQWPDGAPGPMAGHIEGPLIQLYNP